MKAPRTDGAVRPGRFRGSLSKVPEQGKRPVVALVSDAIFPYHRGGKEIRYHELSRRLAGRADVHRLHHALVGRATRTQKRVGHASMRYRALRSHVYAQPPVDAAGYCSSRSPASRLLASRFDVLEADHMPIAAAFGASVRGNRQAQALRGHLA